MLSKILLVDDDTSLLLSLSCYLSDAGFYVDTAHSVSQAIELLNNYNYNLVISDIFLPQRDGYNLVEYIKSTSVLQSIPFMFLTAKGMTNDRIIGYDLGCSGYVTKPFDPAELLSIVRNILLSQKNIGEKNQTFDTYVSNLFTYREQDVLHKVLKGMTNKEIAFSLSLNLRNVEKYVSRLLSKTGTRNRTELAQYFYRERYIKNNF
uniref:TctD-like protein n=1 Tax=Helminthora furcellata TaxID=1884666 RepID=A0A1G4NZH9_9FLOR|nr:Hypothetical protein ycf29 [Helminthora furcellata]SCW21231.1 Hypothetical protein ycf29 [Helminthora furcellata]SCW24091.1 Hypothetical protein ycf29 [Helminthora furcellata]